MKKSGPFPIIKEKGNGEVSYPIEPPRRRYDCAQYETCLTIASALFWDSFTCRGCNGTVNGRLLWRFSKRTLSKTQYSSPEEKDDDDKSLFYKTSSHTGDIESVIHENTLQTKVVNTPISQSCGNTLPTKSSIGIESLNPDSPFPLHLFKKLSSV
jgi:hypothetical protein